MKSPNKKNEVRKMESPKEKKKNYEIWKKQKKRNTKEGKYK